MSLVMNVSNEVLTLPTGAPFTPFTTAVVDTTVQPMADWVNQGRVRIVSSSPGPPVAASVVLGTLSWCGTYDSTVKYLPGQTVEEAGQFYTALEKNAGIDPASDDGTTWLGWAAGGSGGTTYTAGDGITITGTAISVTADTFDAAGAAAAAQTAAETAAEAASDAAGTATTAVATETTRAETAEALLAPKASPTFTGTVTVPTPTGGDSSTKAASTAFVAGAVPAPATATPLIDGTAAVGTATKFAREDHKHPTDTTLAPKASPTFTGTVTVPTPATSDNSTKAASTAMVQALLTALAPSLAFVIRESAGTYPNRATGAPYATSTSTVIWIGVDTPTDGSGFAIDDVDIYIPTSV